MPCRKIKRPNTLVVEVPVAFRSGSKEVFLAKLLEALSPHTVSCVQFVPGFFVRVTFESLESRHAVFGSGIVIEEVMIPVMEADATVRFIHIHHCPIEVPDETVADALSAFGTVLDVQFSCFAGSSLRNGSRVVKMSLQEEIPTRLFVLRYPCRVWYRGQAQVCNICRCPDHRAVSCPLRDLCLKCRQRGHFARDCPGVPADIPDVPVVPDASVAVPAEIPDVPVVPIASVAVPASDVPVESSPPSVLQAVSSLVRNAVSVADFRQPLASQEEISSILARGAARRPPLSAVSSAAAVPVSVFRSPFAVSLPDPSSPGGQCVFDFHNLTRRVVIEDSATFEMYRECYYSDNRGPFPVKSVFLPGCPVPPSATLLDPNVLPAKFPL